MLSLQYPLSQFALATRLAVRSPSPFGLLEVATRGPLAMRVASLAIARPCRKLVASGQYGGPRYGHRTISDLSIAYSQMSVKLGSLIRVEHRDWILMIFKMSRQFWRWRHPQCEVQKSFAATVSPETSSRILLKGWMSALPRTRETNTRNGTRN